MTSVFTKWCKCRLIGTAGDGPRSKTQKQRLPSQQRGREAIERGWKGGQRHWPAPPFHAVSPSQIVEDRQAPAACECESFHQVPPAGRPRIRALPELPPARRPEHQADLCRSWQAAGLTPARQQPGDGPRLTRPSKSQSAWPPSRPGWDYSATLHCGQIVRVVPKHPSRHSRYASDCRNKISSRQGQI